MFKNMVMYRIAAQWQGDLVAVEQALQQALFSPCSATQEVSDGWAPPGAKPMGLGGKHWRAVAAALSQRKQNPPGQRGAATGAGQVQRH